MTAVRKNISDQELVEERISEQAKRLLQYFEDQKGKGFDPSQILMESVANVICRITFGKLFDSSHPDFQELLDINNRVFTDTELNSQVLKLDNFPIAKYFPFKAYQTEKEMTDRMFEILHNQMREQEKAFDPEAEIENLTGSLLKEKLGAENVPKDTVVVPNLMAVHMDPSCWEDPTKFNPHRHIDGDGQVVTNSVNFLPFSAGRRVCAGEALAKVIRVIKL